MKIKQKKNDDIIWLILSIVWDVSIIILFGTLILIVVKSDFDKDAVSITSGLIAGYLISEICKFLGRKIDL